MNAINIFETFQSGFRAHHSTKLLMLTNNLIAADTCDCSVLILLDNSPAFDSWPQHSTELLRNLSWAQWSHFLEIVFHLMHRIFSVLTGSARSHLNCRIVQGSIVGLLIFLAPTTPTNPVLDSLDDFPAFVQSTAENNLLVLDSKVNRGKYSLSEMPYQQINKKLPLLAICLLNITPSSHF